MCVRASRCNSFLLTWVPQCDGWFEKVFPQEKGEGKGNVEVRFKGALEVCPLLFLKANWIRVEILGTSDSASSLNVEFEEFLLTSFAV